MHRVLLTADYHLSHIPLLHAHAAHLDCELNYSSLRNRACGVRGYPHWKVGSDIQPIFHQRAPDYRKQKVGLAFSCIFLCDIGPKGTEKESFFGKYPHAKPLKQVERG